MSSEGSCPKCGEPLGIAGTCYACAVAEHLQKRSEPTEADKQTAARIMDEAAKCCNEIPCRTLSRLIAQALADARETGRQSGFSKAAEIAGEFAQNAGFESWSYRRVEKAILEAKEKA